MTSASVIDLPTVLALVRLRLVTEDAIRRADDLSAAGRHQAVIALDGAVEHALWLATQHAGIVLKNGDRASIPDLYSAAQAHGWNLNTSAWPGVNQLHRARNDAQHAGVPIDREPLPAWRDSARAFISSVTHAAFAIALDDISVVDAVRDPQIKATLIEAEHQLDVDSASAFRAVLTAFALALNNWRGQRDAALPSLARGGETPRWPVMLRPPAADETIQDLLEVQPFASSLGEYVWLRRVSVEQADVGRAPTVDEARRALMFVMGWVVRWEIFDHGYPDDQWDAYRESIEPPTTKDKTPGKILGVNVDFVPEISGRRAANKLLFEVANVPAKGRSPWPAFLDRAITDCVTQAQLAEGSEHADGEDDSRRALTPQWSYWYLSGVLGLQFDLRAPVKDVMRIVEEALALAVQRYDEHLVESGLREQERIEIEAELRKILAETADEQQHIFGDVKVLPDEWAGTGGWMAFVEVLASRVGGDPTERYHAHQAFTNRRPHLENLNQRDSSVTFTLESLTVDIADAVRDAITGAEDMIKRLRTTRAEQMTSHTQFASGITQRYGYYTP
jgi:hypothetical protein